MTLFLRATAVAVAAFACVSLTSCGAVMMGAMGAMGGKQDTGAKIAIESDPPGASCEVFRAGVSLGPAAPTPRSLDVGKDKDTLEVRCALDGHRPAAEPVEATFGNATMGGLVAGGPIGLVRRAATGGNRFYPERVVVSLEPASFADAAARDAFHDKLVARAEAAAALDMARIAGRCEAGPVEFCEDDSRKITARRDAALAEIARRRLAAPVVAAAASR